MDSHGHRFLEAFGLVVHAPVGQPGFTLSSILRSAVYHRVAVYFAGGSYEYPGFLGQRQSEAVVCAQRTYFQRLYRDLEVVDRTGR